MNKSRAQPVESDDAESAVPEDELLDAARAGDTAAFGELVRRHRDKIYARAFSIVRNEDEAVDLSQEAWIKAWQKLGQFQAQASFATWVTRIVINVCLDYIRRERRVSMESIDRMDEEAGGVERLMPAVEVNPAEGLEREELRSRIDEAMEKLSEDHRAVLVMHQFEGLEYKEIAKRMQCSIGTVMSRLFYARRNLARQLTGGRGGKGGK